MFTNVNAFINENGSAVVNQGQFSFCVQREALKNKNKKIIIFRWSKPPRLLSLASKLHSKGSSKALNLCPIWRTCAQGRKQPSIGKSLVQDVLKCRNWPVYAVLLNSSFFALLQSVAEESHEHFAQEEVTTGKRKRRPSRFLSDNAAWKASRAEPVRTHPHPTIIASVYRYIKFHLINIYKDIWEADGLQTSNQTHICCTCAARHHDNPAIYSTCCVLQER